MIDFTLCMYSVYMRDGIKYYKYEEVFYQTLKLPSLTTLNFLRCFKEFFFTLLDIIMRGNYPLNSSQTPWAHLFVLIIYAAHSIQTSYFTPNTLCRAHNLMSLHTSKVQNHNASTSHFDTYPNSPCAHLFILIIFDPISFHASSHLYSKFRYLIKSTRDPISL